MYLAVFSVLMINAVIDRYEVFISYYGLVTALKNKRVGREFIELKEITSLRVQNNSLL